jgi:LuxR family maltose regulon positive regulatory protein
LEALLDQALMRPVLTIVAGAGYGKTTLVSSYLRKRDARVIWVQLSEQDNSSAHFWETFTGAVATLNQDLAATMLLLGFPQSEELLGYFAELFHNELRPRYRYVFVLDDLHLLEEGPVLGLISRLIGVVAKNTGVSAIVLSRCDCLSGAAELSRAGLLTRLDESVLSFTKSEMQEYFEAMGVITSPEMVESIYQDTEGLPFAVSLAARLLEENPEDQAYIRTALRGTFNRIIEERLFSRVSEELKHFLLKLSLVKHLPPELIDKLEGGQAAMNELASISSLIRYDRYMHVYRLHHLLLTYLEGKRDLLTEEERQEVYTCAARWCDANGYRIDALHYYRAMRDYNAIVNTASAYPLVMPHDIAAELLASLEEAPWEFFEANPGALVLYPRLVMTVGRVDEAFALTRKYIALFEKQPPSENTHRVLMGLHNNLGFGAMIRCPETQSYDFARHFCDAFAYVDTAARTPAAGNLIYSVGPYALRVGHACAGDPEAYIEEVRRSVVYTTVTLRGCMHGLESLVASEYAYFRDSGAEAERQALLCVAQARAFGQSDIQIRALYLLVRVYLQAGKYERIMEALAQLDGLMGEQSFNSRYLLYEIITSWFFASIGEVDRVESWLKSDLWSSGLNEHISGLDDFAKAKYYLACKDYETLLAFAEARSSGSGIRRFIIGKVGLAVARAVCCQNLGRREEALVWLRKAYELARPNELWMPFIEMGNAMRNLTTAALKAKSTQAEASAEAIGSRGEAADEGGAANKGVAGGTKESVELPTEWLKTIRSRATTYAKRIAFVRSRYLEAYDPEADVQLTAKELELLSDLSRGLSRTELSLAHGISINTVKTMLQMIYHKLRAESAMDAVRIAVTKHLL